MNAAQHLADFELSYTLAKQIPAMDSGFVIQTVYGDIHVAGGRLAELMAQLVGQEFRLEAARREALAYDAQGARREARPHERDGLGFRFDSPLIGELGGHRPAPEPVAAVFAEMPGAPAPLPGAQAAPLAKFATAEVR